MYMERWGHCHRRCCAHDIAICNRSGFDAAAGRWRVIALTNNFSKSDADIIGDAPPPKEQFPNLSVQAELEFLGWQDGATPPRLRALFDDFCDSSTLGMRYVCGRVLVSLHLPPSAVTPAHTPNSSSSLASASMPAARAREFNH